MTDLQNARRLLASGHTITLAGAASVVDALHAEASSLEDHAHEAEGDERLRRLSRAHDLRTWARRSESFYALNAMVTLAQALASAESP